MAHSIEKEETPAKPADEIAKFCAHIESQLREIKDPVAQLILQDQIQQACFKARMATLRNASMGGHTVQHAQYPPPNDMMQYGPGMQLPPPPHSQQPMIPQEEGVYTELL